MLDIDLKRIKPPFMVHSDLFKTFGFVKDNFKSEKNKSNLGLLHFELLVNRFGKENLIFPSFNYSFPDGKTFDIQHTKSEVGSLTNFVLSNKLLKRTKTPIFSFLSNISEIWPHHGRPFSGGSVFDFLYKNDGTVVFYGADLSSCTFLHFIEDQYGPPLFRYDKKFSGLMIDNGVSEETHVEFHVRPSGLDLDYDWKLMSKLLKSNQVIHYLNPLVFAVKARDLFDIWGKFFSKDQFLILSESTKGPVRAKFNQFGRRFVQKDFESKS